MKDKMKKVFDPITQILVLVGALNWGLVGAFNFNLVEWLLGLANAVSYANVVYIAVGVAAVWSGLRLFKILK